MVIFLSSFFSVSADDLGQYRCSGVPCWGYNGLVSCRGLGCTSACQLVGTFINVVYFGITITLYFIFPTLFAWGGIVILTSAGNPGRIESGKKILTGTLIGILIVLGAWLIIKIFIDVLGAAGKIPGFGTDISCPFSPSG